LMSKANDTLTSLWSVAY